MVDRELLQKKRLLQRNKNILSKIEGIKILDYTEQKIFDENYLQNIGFYSITKEADSKISCFSEESEIIEWIIDLVNFEIEQIWYLWIYDHLIKIQISDVRIAVKNFWIYINPDSKGFVLITENKKIMYEFGNDSRDEDNILFDKYYLKN